MKRKTLYPSFFLQGFLSGMLLISDHIVPIIADLPKRFEQGVDNIAEPPLRAPKRPIRDTGEFGGLVARQRHSYCSSTSRKPLLEGWGSFVRRTLLAWSLLAW